jgi:predicted acetyltransferase/8-oxo-dGTP pyrophosphatase MutT (NUDIX family)
VEYLRQLREFVGHRPIIAAGATLVVRNSDERLLLQLRSDTETWGLPGGAMELGETLPETARRELREETGLEGGELRLLDVLSGPEYFFIYPNGDQLYSVIALYEASGVTEGTHIPDSETLRLSYFSLDELPELESRTGLIIRHLREMSYFPRESSPARLAHPSAEYRDSFLEAMHEFQGEGRFLERDLTKMANDFEGYVIGLLRMKDRATQRQDLVPETRLWLVEGGEFIGVTGIRHELNENLLAWGGHIGYAVRPSKRRRGYGKLILQLALEKSKEIGISRVLVTCSPENVASRKIIESNGGILENEAEVEIDGKLDKKLRYWIDVA